MRLPGLAPQLLAGYCQYTPAQPSAPGVYVTLEQSPTAPAGRGARQVVVSTTMPPGVAPSPMYPLGANTSDTVSGSGAAVAVVVMVPESGEVAAGSDPQPDPPPASIAMATSPRVVRCMEFSLPKICGELAVKRLTPARPRHAAVSADAGARLCQCRRRRAACSRRALEAHKEPVTLALLGWERAGARAVPPL